MPIDRERQRQVKAGVALLRNYVPPTTPDDADALRVETLAEVLALLAADARYAGFDESFAAEVVLRCSSHDKETLAEARHVLAALGYGEIVAVLKRLERSAPRRLTFGERMRVHARRPGRLN